MDRAVIVSDALGPLRLWDLTPETRNLDYLRCRAELTSGVRLDAEGTPVDLTDAELTALDRRLRAMCPEEYGRPQASARSAGEPVAPR